MELHTIGVVAVEVQIIPVLPAMAAPVVEAEVQLILVILQELVVQV